jgi:hypothetical protein
MTLSMTTPEPGRPANRARPYTLTAGRTRPHIELGIEATVETLRTGDSAWGAADARTTIVGLCDDRLSIAEISAYAGMPIGVARVLVADLVESGHLRLYATLADTATVAEQRRLIERTLDGLRAI